MHARVVLGVGKGVLFREVSSVQSPHITTRPRGRPFGDGRNLAFIPVMVHCEGTVEAILVGFEHRTASAVNFTLNNVSLLC